MEYKAFICPYCGKEMTPPIGDRCPYCGNVFDAAHQPQFDSYGSFHGEGGANAILVILYLIIMVFTTVCIPLIGFFIGLGICLIIHYWIKSKNEPPKYTCYSCGAVFQGKREVCPNCGRKLHYKGDPIPQPQYTCPNCNTKLDGKPHFCPNCGLKLNYND